MRVLTQRNQIDMTTGSIMGKQLLFIIPLFFTGMLQLLYNAVDIMVVGKFAGTLALSAVGSTNSLTALFTNVFIGLSIGANVVMATYYGSKDQENIHKTIHSSIMIAIISGVALMILGCIFTPTLLRLMSTPEDVIEQSILYIRIIFIGMPFNLTYNFSAAILRAIGDTKRPLWYLGVAGIINVILNLIFVIVFKLSVAGVALATIIAQAISVTLILKCLSNNDGCLKFSWKNLKLHKKQTLQVIKIGLPAGIQSSFFSFSNVLMQSSVNSFGAIAMAGNAAAANLEGFLYTAANCVQQSVITFAGQNKGAKQYDRVKKNLFYGSALVILVTLIMSNIFRIFDEQILGLYTNDPEAIAVGVQRLSVTTVVYFMCGLMDVTTGFLRGVGRSVGPMIISLLGICGFRVAWILLVFRRAPSIQTLYISYPVSWSICWVILLAYYLIVVRKGIGEGELN